MEILQTTFKPTASQQTQQTAEPKNDASVRLTENFDTFLQLLTQQLQSQDPLSPMDTNQFTQQLVQFSSVEQSIAMNTKLDALVTAQQSNQEINAINYVGKEVDYLGNSFEYSGKNISFKYELPLKAKNVNVNIHDETGNIIHTFSGKTEQGINRVEWDGKNSDGNQIAKGNYSISIESINEEDVSTRLNDIVIRGQITGIEKENNDIYLLVGNHKFKQSQVQKVFATDQI